MAARLASPLLRLHPSVASALAAKKPVVALESTIITHGLPFPANVETAMAIEQAVRDQGAVPATTAFLDGVAHVGLDKSQVERLGEVGLKATKTSRRDVASVLAAGRGSVGATTVSGTMILAHMAGISIFGTGGIGGVHRGGQDSMDVSADLTELSRTPVSVFCSGPKSILDIPRTLEYLETFGVSVSTFNPSGQLPAFYSSHSGCIVPVISSDRAAAELIHSNALFGMQSGMLFGVPIPAEYEKDGKRIQEMVEQAVRESHENGIDKRGKEATPWLLKRVSELSQGLSVKSNKALVINNASTAARVASELSKLQASYTLRQQDEHAQLFPGQSFATKEAGNNDNNSGSESESEVIVVGYTAIDITSQATSASSADVTKHVASTWPGKNSLSLGGVARNMAESAHRILAGAKSGDGSSSSPVQIVSPIGNDILARLVRDGLSAIGMRIDGLIGTRGRTASVLLQLDSTGDLTTGVADIDEGQLQPQSIRRILSAGKGKGKSSKPRVVAFDGNISTAAMEAIFDGDNADSVTIYEPTSVIKAPKIINCPTMPDIMTPNEAEVLAMYVQALEQGLVPDQQVEEADEIDAMQAASLGTTTATMVAARELCRFSNSVLLIKGGSRGVIIAKPSSAGVLLRRFPALKPRSEGGIVNTTGCGDSFAGAVIACTYRKLQEDLSQGNQPSRPRDWSDEVWAATVDIAQQAAILTMNSHEASSPELGQLLR